MSAKEVRPVGSDEYARALIKKDSSLLKGAPVSESMRKFSH